MGTSTVRLLPILLVFAATFASAQAPQEVASIRDLLAMARASPDKRATASLGGKYPVLVGTVFKSSRPIIASATVGGPFPGRTDCVLYAIDVSQQQVLDPFAKGDDPKSKGSVMDESGSFNLGLCPDGTLLMDPRIKIPPMFQPRKQ